MAKSRPNQPIAQATTAREGHMEYCDEIESGLYIAGKLTSCAAVLARLQSMPYIKHGENSAGQGMAGGHELHPDALPVLINHIGDLIYDAKAASNEWHRWSNAINPPQLKVVGGANG